MKMLVLLVTMSSVVFSPGFAFNSHFSPGKTTFRCSEPRSDADNVRSLLNVCKHLHVNTAYRNDVICIMCCCHSVCVIKIKVRSMYVQFGLRRRPAEQFKGAVRNKGEQVKVRGEEEEWEAELLLSH